MSRKKRARSTEPAACGYLADEQQYFPGVKHVHVYPLYGREHWMQLECWCHPNFNPQQPTVIVHHVEH